MLVFTSCLLLQSCGSAVTVYHRKHPKNPKFFSAWVKYDKKSINPDCIHDYIRGRIVDTQNEPLVDASIHVSGAQTKTNLKGEFYLLVPDDTTPEGTVQFEYPGFYHIDVQIKKVTCRILHVRMQPVAVLKE